MPSEPDLPPRASTPFSRWRSRMAAGRTASGESTPPLPPGGPGGRRRRPGRGRVVFALSLAVLFVLLVSLRGVAAFYTDYLWFRSLSLTSVWSTVLSTKGVLTLVGTVVFFLLCWGNLAIADRLAPLIRTSSGDDDLIERYHEIIGQRGWIVRTTVSVALAVIVGLGLGSAWNDWILFANRVDFGQTDATFGKDIGFYVFQLPFLTTAAGWLFSCLVLILFVTLLAHVVNGGIRFHTHVNRVSPQVKAHLSVLLGVLALVQTGRYWLDRYSLTISTRGRVDGATYTPVNVELRSIYLLMLISLFAFALFIANIWRRGWVLPGMAVGLWVLVAILAGGVVPAFVQEFRVKSKELAREGPYVEQNIAATRQAYGLTDVASTEFPFKGNLSAQDLRDDAATVRNIRLWDPPVMQDVFRRQQQIKGFYDIGDVDVDRYMIDGKLTQVMVGARNLNPKGVQSSWESSHLAYTHGYGVVAAAANSKTSGGDPSLLAQDIPVRTTGDLPTSKKSGIYFGEGDSGYVIVKTGRPEIDYQARDNATKTTSYTGKDGIRIGTGVGGFVRKTAFALRFGDINPLISGNITARSRVLIERDVSSRLKSLAPFLAFDHDPYVVIDGGRTKYVVDAYTTTRNYPNAQRADTGGLSADSGLSGRSFNYARNSVKAVVDAYDGTVTFYVVDTKDPIIKAYEKAFPKLFTPGSKAPESLRAHFRYPEDLFRVQTQMWARYHVSDPGDFLTDADRWNIDRESGAVQLKSKPSGGTEARPVGPDGQALTSSDRFEPQYLLMQLPGEKEESFVIMRPFVPDDPSVSDDRQQQLLTSFMTASSDPDDYGKLQSFVMPGGDQPFGPNLVAGKMESSPKVSKDRTLLCQEGSKCTLRNVVMVPINDSLLYVRSLFVQGADAGSPTLQRVIVSYQTPSGSSNVSVDCSLRGALSELFGDDLPSGIEAVNLDDSGGACGAGSAGTDLSPNDGGGGTGTTTTTTTTTPGPAGPGGPDLSVAQQENQLLAQIIKSFDDADTAARQGDQVAYAQNIQKAQDAAKRLQTLRAANPSLTAGGLPDGAPDKGSTTTVPAATGPAPTGSATTEPSTTTTQPVTTTTSAGT